MQIPASHRDLLADDVKAFAFLATVMKDHTPQVTPVWFSIEGDQILINSALGRVKDRNMRSRPQVAMVIPDPKDPYRYIQIRGKVIGVTEQGAVDHIHQLSQKYRGKPYSLKPEEIRVIYRIQPERVDVRK